MGRRKNEPIVVDLTDESLMDWVNEMRQSRPSAKERRKISDWKYYHRHKAERKESNLKWRKTHAEQYAEKQKEYHSQSKVMEKKREASRIRYHTDPEWRETMLAKQRERYHAMTPEQKAEYTRKQRERARIRRAKAKAKKLADGPKKEQS